MIMQDIAIISLLSISLLFLLILIITISASIYSNIKYFKLIEHFCHKQKELNEYYINAIEKITHESIKTIIDFIKK